MIDRYSCPEMKNIWDLHSRFDYYLKVELAVCRAYVKLGLFPTGVDKKIEKKAKFSISKINKIEAEVHHDVIAFLTNINESVGADLAKYIHVGLTSSDVIDTAFSLQIMDSSKIICDDFETLLSIIKKMAFENKYTVCIGRSHGIHAELTTFGLKLLNMYDKLNRAYSNFKSAADTIKVGQISGPVGTYSNVPIELEQLVCEELGLKPAKISTQIIARDYHAMYMQALSLIASVIEDIAVEIRHLQRTEVGEVQEGFGKKQKGSSAMPHKKNPVLSENLCGLARVIRGNANVAMENLALWHERDISHSSAERIIFPDSLTLIDFMLKRLTNIMDNLVINKTRMLANTELYGGIIYSQKVLLELVEKGMSREKAYEVVQANALEAYETDGSFRQNLENDDVIPDYLSTDDLDDCFDKAEYLRNVDKIFARFEE